MAMQASLYVENETGEPLKVVALSKVNDDATFGGVKVGEVVAEHGGVQLNMGNRSFGLAPQGVGAQMTLVNLTASRYLTIYLAIPAAGTAEFVARDAEGIRMERSDSSDTQEFTAKLEPV